KEIANSLEVLNLAAQLFFAPQTLRRLHDQMFQEVVHHGFDARACFGIEPVDALRTLTKKSRTLFAHTGTQGFDQADKFDASLPGKELFDVLVNDGFGVRDLTLAGASVLFDDVG